MPMTNTGPQRKRIGPNQVSVYIDGLPARHVFVTLLESQRITTFREDAPQYDWTQMQSRPDKAVKPGDYVTVIAHDGLTRFDSCTVERIERDRVWLGKPLRVLTFPKQALYEGLEHQVVAAGDGFAIRRKRDGTVEAQVFRSADAAKAELLRRYPTRVA